MAKEIKNFNEQIKSPLWQKRRLEILQKDNFTCQACGDKESQLNVHHFSYDPNKNYWEYEDWQLITLCEKCHSKEHNYFKKEINVQINEIRKLGFTNMEIFRALIGVKWDLEFGICFSELDFVQDKNEKLFELKQRHANCKKI